MIFAQFDKKRYGCFDRPMEESRIFHIIGAGPAGLSAAIVLAQAGKKVQVHERYDVVGKRFQGDLQGLENWSTEENVMDQLQSYGLPTDFHASPFRSVTVTDGESSFLSHSIEPLFYLVKRGPFPDSLDTALCRKAIAAGVQIQYRSKHPDSAADIIATGPIREAVVAVDKGLTFATDLPNMAVGIFHDDLAYQGYSYLLVAEGYGCLCTVVFNDFHQLNDCFNRTVEMAKHQYSLNLDEAHPVGGVGSFTLNHPTHLGNALLVGEAAGFQDLLWGFGIRTAMTSGYLAAHSLLTNDDYASLVSKHLQPALQASMVNRYLWETVKWKKRPLLPYGLQFPASTRTNFRFLYSFSPLHKLLFPIAQRYIKRHYPQSVDDASPKD